MSRAVLALASCVAVSASADDAVRESKFFRVDLKQQRVLGARDAAASVLRLDLVNVSVDQPQYWPHETVRLAVLAPGAGGKRFKATVSGRGANGVTLDGVLDDQGVAVLELLDGAKKKLALGEYRVTVAGEGLRRDTTFSVVDGSLGAVSLAHEFKRVTSAEELDSRPGAWFLGNAAGAGKRWGNGLSFKNELRVNNQPWDGEVECVSRCMLPGCNGVQAGRPLKLRAVKGVVAGTLEVSSHSGPFQIEFITSKGSLRHQFEGSSHVERDMVPASGGVTWRHRVSLAPYDKTTPVPGRQLYVEKTRGSADAFEVDSVVARGRELTLRVTRQVKQPMVLSWLTQPDGSLKAVPQPVGATLEAGQVLKVPVASPIGLVAVGGFDKGNFREGWALAFPPSELSVAVKPPQSGGPNTTVQVAIDATRLGGGGVPVSGVLEVFDNRVAAKSPMSGLASSIGDAMRNASNAVSAWRDNTGLQEEADAAPKEMEVRPPPSPAPAMKAMRAMTAPPASMGAMGGGGRIPGGGGVTGGSAPDDDDAPRALIREGEKKVVYFGVVRTDASGRAVVEVTLPPQTGRVTARFVAVRGVEHAEAQADADVVMTASAEAQLPRVFVPGAKLTVPVSVTNALKSPVTLTASGPGVPAGFRVEVAPGAKEVPLPFTPTGPGVVSLRVDGPDGKALDRREVRVASLGAQPVVLSRLLVSSGAPAQVEAGETAIVYAGPGALLGGVATNMVTTMESWFGHAEALSAKAAASAALLAAASRGLMPDDGLGPTLETNVDKALRDLSEAFVDAKSGLVRPWPGLPANPVWSAWTSRNLHATARLLAQAKRPDLEASRRLAEQLASGIDAALRKRGVTLEEYGYDAQGDAVVPVELDGKVVYRVLTDDAVSRWAAQKVLPGLDLGQPTPELAFSKLYDTFRFLRAYQRVGALQYLTELATGLWAKGDRKAFDQVFPVIARGMVLSQEPGMVQGPALLGGVYSGPMAMVRFLELLLTMADGQPAGGAAKSNGRTVPFGEPIVGAATVSAPAGAVVRIDRAGSVDLLAPAGREALGKATLSTSRVAVGRELTLTVKLADGLDPLEYVALVAAPSTTAVKQTNDILSDSTGQLIYGQQAMGATKTQLVAAPFRGSRTMTLKLEGLTPGTSPGAVVIRHVERADEVGAVAVPVVTVMAR